MGCSNSALCSPAEVGLPPSLHVALGDANAFRAQLAKGAPHVLMLRETAIDRDGDLDNEVVAHEWGHYLSNRLIANSSGLSAQQSRGMGEGWSDFLALLLVARPEDTAVPSDANFNGTYAAAQYVTSGGGNGPRCWAAKGSASKAHATIKSAFTPIIMRFNPAMAAPIILWGSSLSYNVLEDLMLEAKVSWPVRTTWVQRGTHLGLWAKSPFTKPI